MLKHVLWISLDHSSDLKTQIGVLESEDLSAVSKPAGSHFQDLINYVSSQLIYSNISHKNTNTHVAEIERNLQE